MKSIIVSVGLDNGLIFTYANVTKMVHKDKYLNIDGKIIGKIDEDALQTMDGSLAFDRFPEKDVKFIEVTIE